MTEIPTDLDRVFEALANGHRREIIYLLGLQPYSIHHLAEIRGLSLPAIHKHIKLLENAGIVKRRKIGRTNFLTLNRRSVRTLQDWLGQYRKLWEARLDRFEAALEARQREQARGEKTSKRSKKK